MIFRVCFGFYQRNSRKQESDEDFGFDFSDEQIEVEI